MMKERDKAKPNFKRQTAVNLNINNYNRVNHQMTAAKKVKYSRVDPLKIIN